ncbi:hypothetical protein HD806DRAFT_488058 [Xylariaceae sp. AK1471]|nr:hypothetical protein HD806DRAFT_488058 [Xylariaceae sp. AK1471]
MRQFHSRREAGPQDDGLPPSKRLRTGSSSKTTYPLDTKSATENRRDDTSGIVSQQIDQSALVSEPTAITFTGPETEYPPLRPSTCHDFEIAIICALPLEADAVEALFDKHWNNSQPHDVACGDPNAYTAGVVGRHNVVLVHMPGMGKVNAAAVAAYCRTSFPNIKLAVVVGVCGAVPLSPDGNEIVLGDVIISDGVVQYDIGRRFPDRFVRKDTLLDSLSRPNAKIRALLAKLKGRHTLNILRDKITRYLNMIQCDPELAAQYPGVTYDRLFETTYHHIAEGRACDEGGCNGPLVPRNRLKQGNPQPAVHIGLIASGDTVMRSGEERDAIAKQECVLGFEMEGAGVWDSFPCVVIKGVCDYADSHKTKSWQRYAAATAAACMKAFLELWVPSISLLAEPYPVLKQPSGPWFLVPYPRNDKFVDRAAILGKLQQQPLKSTSQTRASLFGLGGVGKTQIVLEYAYRLREKHPDVSVFWVRASNADQFRHSFHSIALECGITGYDDPKVDVLLLVTRWLERSDQGWWLMIIDNADNAELFFPTQQNSTNSNSISQNGFLAKYIPECAHGSILVTTRNKQAGLKLAKGISLIEIYKMSDDESQQLLRLNLGGYIATPSNLLELSSRLEHLPLALVQASAFIQENTIPVDRYLRLLDQSDQDLINLLSEEFKTVGRDLGMSHAVAATWILSFEQIEQQNRLASELLSLMSLFDRQGIPMEFLSDFNKSQQSREHQDDIQDIQLIKALGVLKAYSLVTEDARGLDMHRLVQLVTRKWLTTKGKMPQFVEKAILTVSHCYPHGKFETREKCTAYLPHAQAVLKLDSIRSRVENIARALILNRAAALYDFEGQGSFAEKFQMEAEEINRDILGPEHPDTLRSMNNLALTYMGQGRWKEAESLQVQVMETYKVVLGPEHSDTLTSMNNLASTYWSQGRWKEAESLQVQVIETSKVVLGPEHPYTLISMGNLAFSWNSQGRGCDAIVLMEQCAQVRVQVLGLEHPSTQSSLSVIQAWRIETSQT